MSYLVELTASVPLILNRMSETKRDEVIARWQQLISGSMSREEVREWAWARMMDDDGFDDLLTGQALQYLHGFVDRSDDEIAKQFDRWQIDVDALDERRGLLRRAREEYLALGDRAGVRRIDDDLARLGKPTWSSRDELRFQAKSYLPLWLLAVFGIKKR
jgi:hypothetical protein